MSDAPLQVLVKSITFEAERINAYTLHPVNGQPLPSFTAGAHVELHLSEGTIRSYSLINDQCERHRYVIAVKREQAGRGGSAHIHDRVKVGDVLAISAPHNNFAFDETGRRSVFVAGGIGVTPIVSMIRRAARLGHPWTVHYASRTRRDAAFLSEIEALAFASGGEVNAVFDQEAGGGALNIPAIVSDAHKDAPLLLRTAADAGSLPGGHWGQALPLGASRIFLA
jgi:tetrachlorobenzoquinone reductase